MYAIMDTDAEISSPTRLGRTPFSKIPRLRLDSSLSTLYHRIGSDAATNNSV